jgi:predicted DNA-binding protein with PD1-like motif
MIRQSLLLTALVGAPVTSSVAAAVDIEQRYTRTPSGYLMVLRHGDDVLASLKQLATREHVRGASFTGLGYARTATFGFYDYKTESYLPRTFDSVEVAGLTGTIAWKNDEPSIHAHGVVSDEEFQARGGHLLDLMVGTGSMEITITLHDTPLERKKDPDIGADVLEPAR